MQVGINLPWYHYDWDFGEPPRGPSGRAWGERAAWRRTLAQDLDALRDLGIFAVRFWILGSGLAYGVGPDAPRSSGPGSITTVPRLPPPFIEDFREMLAQFRAASMRIMPVFVDFKMFLELPLSDSLADGYVKGHRQELIADATKRPTFLANALTPLLQASRGFDDVIYAWDLINEPEWCVRDGGDGVPSGASGTLRRAAMLAFLRDGIAMINRAGFRSSVGFASRNTIDVWNSIELGVELHQFHYYGRRPDIIPRHTYSREYPMIVGEFATAPHRPWPELAAAERQDPRTIVLGRLRHLRQKGYPAAFLWSAQSPAPASEPGRPASVEWTDATREQVRRFIAEG